jgi:hypothetical protein
MGIRMVRIPYILLGLAAAIFLSSSALASNTTLTAYCPKVVCTNTPFQVYADYRYNNSEILGAHAFVGETDLEYNSSSGRYDNFFVSGYEDTWNYTVWATSENSTYDNLSVNCSTRILTCYNLTVCLWQEQELRTYANTSNYILTERNYNKQLNRPYINDFAWVIAQNQDQNGTAAYQYCNVPFGSGQSLTSLLNIGNWMGNAITHNITSSIAGRLLGCENFWFRAKLVNGCAVLSLPFAGNYSLSLIDGTMSWENDVSPPKITKSNLFLPLGPTTVPDKNDYTLDIWISHAELDWWGSFLSSMYPIIIIAGSLLIFILLIIFGVSFRVSLGFVLLWIILWTILRML